MSGSILPHWEAKNNALIAVVWRVNDGRCLNDDILAAGHAVPYAVKLALP